MPLTYDDRNSQIKWSEGISLNDARQLLGFEDASLEFNDRASEIEVSDAAAARTIGVVFMLEGWPWIRDAKDSNKVFPITDLGGFDAEAGDRFEYETVDNPIVERISASVAALSVGSVRVLAGTTLGVQAISSGLVAVGGQLASTATTAIIAGQSVSSVGAFFLNQGAAAAAGQSTVFTAIGALARFNLLLSAALLANDVRRALGGLTREKPMSSFLYAAALADSLLPFTGSDRRPLGVRFGAETSETRGSNAVFINAPMTIRGTTYNIQIEGRPQANDPDRAKEADTYVVRLPAEVDDLLNNALRLTSDAVPERVYSEETSARLVGAE